MSLIDNPFTGRNEVIFICYEDILRCKKVRMLDNYRKKYADEFNHMSPKLIKDMDRKNLLRFCLTSGYENPLLELFDKELLEDDLLDPEPGVPLLSDQLKTIFEQDDELIVESPVGRMMGILQILFNQKFVEHIYIYSEKYDIREHVDIEEQFGKYSHRCSYIFGDFETVLKTVNRKVTFYMFNKIVYAVRLFKMDKKYYEYSEVNIADVGYNYIYDDLNDVVSLKMEEGDYNFEEMIVKFGMFSPFVMDDTYFTSNDYVEMLSQMYVEAYNEAETDEEKDAILKILKFQSDDIEDVKKNGDHKLAHEFAPGDVIEPGKFPDDTTGFTDSINKL